MNRLEVHPPTVEKWLGRAVERTEDNALLQGYGQYADDLAEPRGLTHAAFLRSPHAHASLVAINADRASALPGVRAVITGAQMAALGKPFITGVKVDAPQYPLALDRVRYVGEPVAIVVAANRYIAEDALALIEVEYEVLPAVISPQAATLASAPRLHPHTDSNVLHQRQFDYGATDAAFASAHLVVEASIDYPRNSCTPIECSVVVARHDPGEDLFDIQANFQGPYTLHTVMARSLGVPGNRLRLRTPPDSGGSFGVKQSVFPYVVAIGLAAKIVGRPVKWIEDRLEHLSAATSATNRVTTLRGAFASDGQLLALDYDQLEDCGAYLRAPEPATLYRMHGNMTGAYAVQNLRISNRVVVTNKTPTGLNRGFGGPQIYFPLERLIDEAAKRLHLDPIALRVRNFVLAAQMPYRTASGALLDSGDYAHTVAFGCASNALQDLRARRDRARAAGKFYGIGCAAVVEPSVSNMGYITTLMTPAERARSGPKNGALATATVSLDPSGSVTVHAASIPQGQGHKTVLAQVVADVLGIRPEEIVVLMDHDTGKDAWSIASGNYSSRFAAVVAGAANKAALSLRERIADIAAADLNARASELEFVGGYIRTIGNPENQVPLARTAAKAHWSPLAVPDSASTGLRETATWTMPELSEPDAQDRVNSSGAYGFIFDLCGIEIDADTAAVRIDRYITTHDAGTLLNPLLADGQIRGGFAHGLGAALLESLDYNADGGFVSGTFADYLPPTACEVPNITILHDPHPSPFTPLGAKGLGEGNCMSTPVCLANAVADALNCEIRTLPLTRDRVSQLLHGQETPASNAAAELTTASAIESIQELETALPGHGLNGSGESAVSASREVVWQCMLNPEHLQGILPGCKSLEQIGANEYVANMVLGVGPIKGEFSASFEFIPLEPWCVLRINGQAAGPLGNSSGTALLTLVEEDGVTTISYDYQVQLTGKVAAVGGRLIDGAARALVKQLVAALAHAAQPADAGASPGWAQRLKTRWQVSKQDPPDSDPTP
jgi:2-furoyl-CoA dehydrogenase large subunit